LQDITFVRRFEHDNKTPVCNYHKIALNHTQLIVFPMLDSVYIILFPFIYKSLHFYMYF